MSRIYLDHASSTPLDRRVFREMKPFFTKKFFNASAIYKEGVEIKKAIEDARKRVAKILNAQAKDIIFTSGGTESANLALQGVVRAYRNANPEKTPHIIVSAIEHPAILEVCKYFEEEKLASVTYLPVNENGEVSAGDVTSSLQEDTALVSVMYANNEIGTVEPVKEIARRVKLWKIAQGRKPEEYPFVHTDASQAPCYLELDREKLGLDMMTLDGQKIYGPKGVGVLFAKSFVPLSPIIFGGSQEKSLRAGTENIAGIAGFAKALEIAQGMKEKESARLLKLQKYFFDEVKKVLPVALVNGGVENRLPNNINFCVPSVDAEFLVLELDARGVACAYGSACKNLNEDSVSQSVLALPQGASCARSSIRLSMGRGTSKSHLKKVLKLLPELVKKARRG